MILETKLQPPSLKPNTLHRERLLKLLKNHLERKLVLVTGDAGYGKTTLLAQAIEEANLSCVFYDLDKGDSDLVVFYSYLVHGLEKLQKGLASRTKGFLEQGGEVGKNYELLFGTLINELVEKRKEELFFVLDDYHALPGDSLVHQALDYFIDHLPDTVHVVVSSRTMPPLPSLAKWRAKQDLFELTREGLKFTEEEVKALLTEVYKTVLNEEELKRVSEQTEGWITGIQLILQSAGKGGKVPAQAGIKETLNGYLEANQPLFDYFANEIIARESLEVQNFLMKSSILDTITSEVCDRIFGIERSGELLRKLEKSNLFVSLVGKGEYRFHRLFREYLASQIKDEGVRKSLHLKAADYYQRNGQWEQAIEHYLEAGSYEWAGKVIGKVADDMGGQARFTTLERWLKRIAESVLQKQPRLLIVLGTVYREQGHLEKAKVMYNRAERQLKAEDDTTALANALLEQGMLQRVRGSPDGALRTLTRALAACPSVQGEPVEPSVEKLRADILNILGLSWMELGDLRKARAYLFKARRASERVRDAYVTIVIEANWASLLLLRGEMRLAFDAFKSHLERLEGHYRLRVGSAFANAVKAALDLGQVTWAERCLAQGLALCGPYEDPWSRVALHFGLGSLSIEKALWGEAKDHLEQARDESAKLHWFRVELAALRDLGRLCRYQRDFEQARGHLELARSLLGSGKGKMESPLGATLLTELGRLEAACGRSDNAEKTVRASLGLARRFGLNAEEFIGQITGVEIHLARGKGREAARLLRRALRLSKLKGYDGVLMRELRHSPRLLELAEAVTESTLKKGADADYLRGILTKCGALSLSKGDKPTLGVRLFGTFEILEKGISKTSLLKRRTTKAILAYFLLHPKGCVSWEEVTAWVWPNSPAKTAHVMFLQALWEIRKCIPALRTSILYQANRYRINLKTQVWVDALVFQDLLKQAAGAFKEAEKIGFLEEAAALYQGPLLPGVYHTWADDLRNAVEEDFTRALGALAELYAKMGEYEKSVANCLKFLKVDDLDERIHRLLISNFIHLDQKSKALQRYEKLKRILCKNLKAEPSPETTSLIESLLKPLTLLTVLLIPLRYT